MADEQRVVGWGSSDRHEPGEVLMRPGSRPMVFRLRCTSPGCTWKATVVYHATAQRVAFEHAGQHQFGPSYRVPA